MEPHKNVCIEEYFVNFCDTSKKIYMRNYHNYVDFPGSWLLKCVSFDVDYIEMGYTCMNARFIFYF